MTNADAPRPSVVLDHLRTDILDGTYAPDTPLRELALSKRFGVSRRTIREALLALSDQGLVTRRHHTGAAVRSFTSAEVADLYRVRRMLECEGARSVAGAADARLSRVEQAFVGLQEAAEDGTDPVAVAEADMTFHGAVIALCGSPAIDAFYTRIGVQMTYAITILQRHGAAPASQARAVVAEHRAIKDALVHRDVYEAQRLILDHIGTYEQVLLSTTTA